MDPVQMRVFQHLSPRRGRLTQDLIHTIAYNITFLIKYTMGADVKANQVSVSIIDVRGPKNEEVGHKALVAIYKGPGDFTVVVWKQVKWHQHVIIGLTEKVDKAIKDILAKERNKGYGDLQ